MIATTRPNNNLLAVNNTTPHSYTNNQDVIEQFKIYMAANGVIIQEPIFADGKIHRYHNENDKPYTRNVAVILHLDNNPRGYFKNHKTGDTQTWCADGQYHPLHHTDRLKNELKRQQHQAEVEETQKQAANKAVKLWENAIPATHHPYLERKQIQPHQLRICSTGALLVPIYNRDRVLVNIQFINADGTKRFLSGAKKHSCFSVIGTHSTGNMILICEGWATAASVNEHTDHLTVVALDAGNLKPVAEIWRQLQADAEIIICGDNDLSGVGQAKAQEAALASNSLLMIPPIEGMDFNDWLNKGHAIDIPTTVARVATIAVANSKSKGF